MNTTIRRVLAAGAALTVGAWAFTPTAATSTPVTPADVALAAPAPTDAVQVDELVLEVDEASTGSTTSGPTVDPADDDTVVADRALADGRVATEVIDTTDRQTVGVTWPESEPGAALDVQMRSKTDGTWSEWTPMEVSDLAPDAGTADALQAQTRAGTDSVWIGDAEAVQLSVVDSAVDVADVRLAVIGSETSAAAQQPSAPTSPEPSATAAGSTPAQPAAWTGTAAAQPAVYIEPASTRQASSVAAAAAASPVITRAQWGAAAPTCTMGSAPLVGASVHHTAGSNSYTSVAAAMQQIRNDQRYHMQARGWCDLGYNFVVDKWGNIYEGRAGSLTSSVIGVHSGGFNTGTVGISMLGDYSSFNPSQAVIGAVAGIIGWKFAAAGIDPAGSMWYYTGEGENSRFRNQSVHLPRVFGHRDVSYTACPGTGGYLVLPMIRQQAQNPFFDVSIGGPFGTDIKWLVSQKITTGYADGTFRPGEEVSRQAMAAFLYRAAGSPSFTAPAVSPFTDVPVDNPFYKEISWLAAEGISTGTDLGGGKFAFKPADPISRQAMAAFLYQSAGSPEFTAPTVSPFTDVADDNPFYKEISWLAATGISTGTNLGGGKFAFKPADPVSRQAMAAFLHRASSL